nr:unnamed protein product [Digitaria exilis]
MAADSSMGFHQGITASMYNHHMLSFQANSDVGIGGGATGGMVMAPRSMSGSSSNAGLFHSPNPGVVGNASGVGPSRSSSGDAFRGTGTPKYKFVTGSPSDWTEHELCILKEGLARYAREPNIMKYIKIAAMLPNRTIRDVALRCWWTTGKDKRKKPDGFFVGKKNRDMKTVENMDLFLRTSSNIKTILSRMSETPGIMGQMASLPSSINEDNLNSLIQLNRMVASYGTPSMSHHTKQEPRS